MLLSAPVESSSFVYLRATAPASAAGALDEARMIALSAWGCATVTLTGERTWPRSARRGAAHHCHCGALALSRGTAAASPPLAPAFACRQACQRRRSDYRNARHTAVRSTRRTPFRAGREVMEADAQTCPAVTRPMHGCRGSASSRGPSSRCITATTECRTPRNVCRGDRCHLHPDRRGRRRTRSSASSASNPGVVGAAL